MAFNVFRTLVAACGAIVALHAGAAVIVPLGARSYKQAWDRADDKNAVNWC